MNWGSWGEAVAKKKTGNIEGWEAFRWTMLGDDGEVCRIIGAVPRILSRGPNKGKKTWRGQPSQTVYVTKAELEAACTEYETTTGKCSECMGDGQIVTGFGSRGTTYAPCKRCEGQGSSVQQNLFAEVAA